MITLKILAGLLSYPDDALLAALPEMAPAIVDDALLAPRQRAAINGFLSELGSDDLLDLQERYVNLFDRTRSLSLHLFEHVHGESRDRGQAMIDLKAQYESSGLEIGAAELPDFLPLFLEFLSTRPRVEAYELLGQPAHILSAFAERLRKRHSAYEVVFRALVALAATKPKGEDISALLAEHDPDATDLAALDAAWEDEPVTFGPSVGNACKDGLIAKIRAGRRPAPGVAQGASRPVMPRP